MLLDRRIRPLVATGLLLALSACGSTLTFVPIGDQTVTLGEPVLISVTIVGAQSASVNAISSNQNVVPNANIVVTGSDATYDVTITPTSTVTGTTTITITAVAGAATATRSFRFTVREPFTGSGQEVNGTGGELVGSAVAVTWDLLVAGGNEYAFVYSWAGDHWQVMQRLTASDAGPGQNFGGSVAVWGDVIVVGSDTHGGGAAYVFERTGDSWAEVAKLVDHSPATQDRFGRSVAVIGDTVVVGAQGDENEGVTSGSVFVFTKQDVGGWSLWGKLGPQNPIVSDTLGEDVDLDYGHIIAGNYGHNAPGHDNAGSATIYILSGDVWTVDDTLSPTELEASDHFGVSVAISGEYALVGAPNDDDAGLNAGAVYVYHRGVSGWTEVDKLTPANAAPHEAFGYTVALDYPYAVVGAYNDNEPVSRAGSAYVYRHDGAIWHVVAELDAPEPKVEERFGWDVDIAGMHLVASGGEEPNVVGFYR